MSPQQAHGNDPIVALASGAGAGAIAVLRLSGKNSWKLFSSSFLLNLDSPPIPRTLKLYSLKDPSTKEILDEALCVFFVGPNSFTGEDCVEINCHGGPYIIQKILTTLIQGGARMAHPGEFTKRALLNGKLDLTAAEGIKDLVEAQTHQQWKSGRQLYTGKLKSLIEELRSRIIESMAWLEAMIDFPDEGDTQHLQIDHVTSRVLKVESQIDLLISSFQSGHIASQGLMVVIAGVPNSGKSTLFNSLLQKNRAIVSEIEGTTRDYLEEKCLVDGRLIRLVDVAGLRKTNDLIEKEGVERSKELIHEADLVIVLFASDSKPEVRAEMNELATSLADKKTIKLLTKSDLGLPSWADDSFLKISSKKETGISNLKSTLAAIVDSHITQLGDAAFITSARHQDSLLSAKTGITNFWNSLNQKSGHEILAFELQVAARALGSVIGELSNEDILDKVFNDFCIGK